MKRLYGFLRTEEREWIERCQTLAVVMLIVVLGLLAGTAFST